MPLQFLNQNTYAWAPHSPRPAKPQQFSRNLQLRFVESNFARTTTLAQFITAHPNAAANGVLNQLHRRHVISWNLIKRFIAQAAAINFNQHMIRVTQDVFTFFGVGPIATTAAGLIHGVARAQSWGRVAHQMCWVDNNVYVGPSAGNVGVGFDQGDELTASQRSDLLAGAAWRGAAHVHATMTGFVDRGPGRRLRSSV